MNKSDFISKWSNWWIMNKDKDTLNEAFEKEFDELIQKERFTPIIQGDVKEGAIKVMDNAQGVIPEQEHITKFVLNEMVNALIQAGYIQAQQADWELVRGHELNIGDEYYEPTTLSIDILKEDFYKLLQSKTSTNLYLRKKQRNSIHAEKASKDVRENLIEIITKAENEVFSGKSKQFVKEVDIGFGSIKGGYISINNKNGRIADAIIQAGYISAQGQKYSSIVAEDKKEILEWLIENGVYKRGAMYINGMSIDSCITLLTKFLQRNSIPSEDVVYTVTADKGWMDKKENRDAIEAMVKAASKLFPSVRETIVPKERLFTGKEVGEVLIWVVSAFCEGGEKLEALKTALK